MNEEKADSRLFRLAIILAVVSHGIAIAGYFFLTTGVHADPMLKKKAIILMVSIDLFFISAFASFVMLLNKYLEKEFVFPVERIRRTAMEYLKGNYSGSFKEKENSDLYPLSLAIDSMASSIKGLDELRERFITSISHDFRTPMTSIIGYIDCIRNGSIPENKIDENLALVREEAVRLTHLFDVTLDLSRIQSGDRKFVKERFLLSQVAREVLVDNFDRLEQKNIEVIFDEPEYDVIAFADRDSVIQVLGCIIDNALRFCKPDSRFYIQISDRCGYSSVAVFNQGEGAKYEDQPYLFEEFYKADKTRGQYKDSSGLGLYLCKSIVEAQGGKVGFVSQPGEFFECFASFPLEHPDPAPWEIGRYGILYDKYILRKKMKKKHGKRKQHN